MYIVHVMSARSAASLSVGSLRISVLYKAIFAKYIIESLRLLSLQVHSFWMVERLIQATFPQKTS